jgi:hypothetical protein
VLASQVHQPGTRYWLFGAARGAWSARSLAGLMACAGLLAPALAPGPAALDLAEGLWLRSRRQTGALPEGRAFWGDERATPIRLVGVWETVGALGVPAFNGLQPTVTSELHLHECADHHLNARVQHGRQALAIDERRADFEAAPWAPRDSVRQVWFAGDHGDVIGQDSTRHGLSDLSLGWMLDEAQALGLPLDTRALLPPLAPDPLADRHDDARRGPWPQRRLQPRLVPADAELHPGVLRRLRERADYRPAALQSVAAVQALGPAAAPTVLERLLPLEADQVWVALQPGEETTVTVHAVKAWNATGVRLCAGERCTLAVDPAFDLWYDDAYPSTAEGYDSPTPLQHWGEGVRRMEHERWFSLIAAVHADGRLEDHNPHEGNLISGLVMSLRHRVGGIDQASQRQFIGRAAEFTALRDGHLYLFANDVAWAYSNNSGRLRVHIRREA